VLAGREIRDQAVTDEKGEFSALALARDVYVQVLTPLDSYQQLGHAFRSREQCQSNDRDRPKYSSRVRRVEKPPIDERRTVPKFSSVFRRPI
jgi:hypothetical protein